MEGIDLPLISDDDELDYDLLDASDIPSGFKVQAATSVSSVNADAKIIDEATETPAEASIHQPARKRRTNETFDSDASDGEMASNVGEEDNEGCEDDNGESGAGKFFGRLAGRVKRLGDKRQRLVSPTFEDEEEVQDAEIREQFLGGFEQILDGKKDEHRRNLNDSELEALYASLDVDTEDPSIRFNALYVTGTIEQMTTFDISRIFASFKPETVRPFQDKAFIVTFANAIEAAQLLLDMTKPLRRVRALKKPEEGELVDSSDEEEEEGQVKEEDGDDVAIVKEGNAPKNCSARSRQTNSEAVEVNVDTVKVPQGKWRVVVQHVPADKLIYVRLANGVELRHAIYLAKNWENDGEYNYKNTKIRPGLDVFDEKGKELDWDYEHDTRFFEEEKSPHPPTISDEKPPENLELGGIKIRSRGRGTKKFLKAFSSEDSD
uniref:RRM domain-containing protein n=1 Tax=Meloidogyne incognita TaxID=6306 RepID=A0A914KKH8_MELIC